VLYGHVFRNAMLIVIAGFPAAFIGVFFGGSLIIETIFSLDGLGRLGFEAAVARDYPVIFGTLFVFGLIGLLVRLLSDLMYVWIDPRIDFRERARWLSDGLVPDRTAPLPQPPRSLSPLNRRAFWSLRSGRFSSVLFGLSLFAEFWPTTSRSWSVSRRLYMPIFQLLPRDRIRRRFPDRGEIPRPRGAVPDRTGGWRIAFTIPRPSSQRCAPAACSPARRWCGLGDLAADPLQLQHRRRSARPAPSPPDANHWLGTDDTARDVLARVIYGFRLSVLFALIVTVCTTVIGIAAGAIQGYFGG
jgi:ABC-type dipeptide/oligopeptide/nickel transport system permease subunit